MLKSIEGIFRDGKIELLGHSSSRIGDAGAGNIPSAVGEG